MDADRLLSLLGLRDNDPAVEAGLVELRTKRRATLDPDDRDALYDWVLVRRQGVELGFVDEAYFEADEKWKRRTERSALVLFQVYFYTERPDNDVERFTGKLPFALEWANDRKEVRRKLQRHEAFRRSYLRDAWERPEFWNTVSYKKAGKSIDTVLCQLEPKPWPEEGRVQPMVRDWLELLGLPASSSQLRERLQPLDLAKRIAEEDDEEEVDFRYECGLELDFTPARNLKGVYRARLARKSVETRVLGAVRFFRARHLDARQWTGELPFGLAFDDTQHTMRAKVPRKPHEQEDDDLDGYALWRFPEFSLHVLYDNMKNRLLRISVMAPGFD